MNNLVLLILIFSLLGCSLDASILGPREESSIVIQTKVSNKEIVPLSQQGTLTSAGYRVQSSVSYYKGKAEVVTQHGYKVQSTVQSTLYRE